MSSETGPGSPCWQKRCHRRCHFPLPCYHTSHVSLGNHTLSHSVSRVGLHQQGRAWDKAAKKSSFFCTQRGEAPTGHWGPRGLHYCWIWRRRKGFFPLRWPRSADAHIRDNCRENMLENKAAFRKDSWGLHLSTWLFSYPVHKFPLWLNQFGLHFCHLQWKDSQPIQILMI